MTLHEVGEHEYVGETPGWRACELYFRQTFLYLLKRFDWSFARKVAKLNQVPTGWVLPDDCLHIVELRGLRHWRLYGRVIVQEGEESPDNDVEVVYTSSAVLEQETVPDDMPDFSQCLVLYLAAAICGCVSGDEDKRQELLSRAELVLREAMLVDATQDASNDQHPLERLLNNSITA